MLMKNNNLEKTVKKIIDSKSDQALGHSFDHLRRVRDNALSIAKNYPEIDKDALEAASLLHDIDQSQKNEESHAKDSAAMAEKIMKDLGYDKKFIKKVSQIIVEHSTENIVKKSSIEAKILFDADKIDGLGAIGIARVFLLCGQKNMVIEKAIRWYRKKIEISKQNLQTKEGNKLFKKKIKYVENFLREIEENL